MKWSKYPLPDRNKIYPRAPNDKSQRVHHTYYVTRNGNTRLWNATMGIFIDVVGQRDRDRRRYGRRPRDIAGTEAWRRNQARKKRYRDMPHNKRRKQQQAIFSTYGLDHDAYTCLFVGCGYKCLICRCGVQPYTPTAHVDHCHVTGRVRGILCGKCNLILGSVEKRPRGWGARAEAYLEAHSALRGTTDDQ